MVHAKTDTFTFFFTNNIWFSLLLNRLPRNSVPGRPYVPIWPLSTLFVPHCSPYAYAYVYQYIFIWFQANWARNGSCCCCFMLYAVVVLPSFISTPSVRPDSFSERDTDSVVTGRKTEEDKQTKSNRKFKCQASECRPKWGGYFF